MFHDVEHALRLRVGRETIANWQRDSD